MRHPAIAIAAISLAFAVTGGAGIVRAAQTSPVEKAIEGVKNKLDDLVNAKDEKNPDELTFRIATLRKVIEFSITEASDLKVKLIATEVGKEAKPWKETTLEKIDAALAHYKEEKERLEDEEHTIDLAGVKAAAENFKEWRAANFLTVADTAQDLLLIIQEQKAIETAQKRAQKIGEDVQKLKSARQKIAKNLATLLEEANDLIAEAAGLNETARTRFWDKFITPLLSATSTAGAASSTAAMETATSSEILPLPNASTSTVATSTVATSTVATSTVATSTVATSSEATSTEAALPLPPSIRDLVKSSLAKVREAYRVFIEMSTLVRKVFT